MLDRLARDTPRFILIVGDEGGMLLPVNADTPIMFAATRDEVSRQAILNSLAQNPKMPVTVLCNAAAQEFRIETLPPLNFIDRFKLSRRRLRQAFPLAYASAGRMLDRTHVLLAGLQHGGAVAPWLTALADRRFSFGLLPMESEGLLAQLVPEAKKGWAMLLANFQCGGLRQIVTHDGKLVLTRQTQGILPDADPKDIAVGLARVIADSRNYLARFGLAEAADLRVTVMLGHAELALLKDMAAALSVTVISPREATDILALPFTLDEDCADSEIIFAAWIAKRARLAMPLTPLAMKQRYRAATIAAAGMRAALAMLALAFLVTGWDAGHYGLKAIGNFRAARDLRHMHERVAAEQNAVAPAAAPLGRLRAALERRRLFASAQPMPWTILQQVQQGLDGKARLIAFEWHDDDSLRMDLRLQDSAANDRETTIKNFKLLAERLAAAMPGYSVNIARYPFPALPQETLTNSADTQISSDGATASLTVRRKS